MADELGGEIMARETGTAESDKKIKRKRLKKLCADIREQMEFYFSDSNLHKDRFLGGLMKQSPDGYVDLEVFSRFNKLRCLTTDMTLVAKALTTSDLFEVSEDKKRVKRSKPLSDMSDVDERTVYVEYLPQSVTHGWIKTQFSTCGRVLYVSLPKFRSTGDHKGFAFVEFATKPEAQEACEMLNNPPASASEHIGKFPRSNKQLDQLQKQLPPDVSAEELVKENIEETGDKKTKKRKHEGDENTEEESKRVKTEEKEPEKTDSGKHDKKISVKEQKSEAKKKKRKRKTSECSVDSTDVKEGEVRKVPESDTDTSEVLGTNGQNTESKKRKSDDNSGESSAKAESKKVRISDMVEVKTAEPVKKKRKRRKDKAKEKNRPKDIPELRVIPKQEWLQLRKEYLKLQKKSMTALKKNLNALKHPPKKKENEKPKKTLEFVPNVIVKIESDQPTNRKSLKESLGNAGSIAYIDVDMNEHLAHIRCHNAESAKSVATAGVEGYTLKLLQGDEEKSYWDKLRNDQERKLTQPRTKKRGTQKVTEKAHRATREVTQGRTKHVFFDE